MARSLPPTPERPAEELGLIRRLQADDPSALERLVADLWAPLLAYAQRIQMGSADAEDRVQEAFARLWLRRRVLKEEGSLKALLYTMVRNTTLDGIRKQARRDAADQRGPAPPQPRTPYEDVHGAELQRAAAAAVARLPARRQEVFRLVREEGLSYQEVAEVMALSPQTVANHMSLAMADLRTAMRPFLEGRGEAPGGEADLRSRRDPLNG